MSSVDKPQDIVRLVNRESCVVVSRRDVDDGHVRGTSGYGLEWMEPQLEVAETLRAVLDVKEDLFSVNASDQSRSLQTI